MKVVGLLIGIGVFVAAVASAQATIVFTRYTKSYNTQVWMMNDNASGLHKLVNGDAPKISPDGQQVVYAVTNKTTYVQSLYVMPAAGGTARLLVRNVTPQSYSWSPDSQLVATGVQNRLGTSLRLVVVNVASGAQTKIMKGNILGASFAPTSDKIVFGRGKSSLTYPTPSDVYLSAVTGGVVTNLTNNKHSNYPVWGPQKIAYDQFTNRKNDAPIDQVWTMNADGTSKAQLTHMKIPTLVAGVQPLAWTSDGQQIVSNYTGQDTFEGYVVNATTGAARDIGAKKFDGTVSAAVSKDGKTILVQNGGYEAYPESTVGTVPIGGGKVTKLAKGALPDWNS